MALSNHERVGKALDMLKAGLPAFVERELKSAHGTKWLATARTVVGSSIQLGGTEQSPEWDAAGLLRVMWECWNDVFAKTLGRAERSIVSELSEVRNKWAHQKPFSTDDAYRALDSIHRLLNAVGAGKETDELDRQKSELMRVKFDEQARHERRKTQPTLGLESGGVAGLKPWREVVTPHPDVASGRYQQAEFAADLWQVYRASFSPEIRKTVSDEYADAQEFFRRTFLTVGLKDLLIRAVRRLASDGSDPVVELQTNFGGGKTHSMLALWHLFSGRPVAELPGIDAVMAGAKAGLPKQVRRVVLVGNKISPGQPVKKDDGTVVRTLWGELAWQLGGQEGYALVKQADETVIEKDVDGADALPRKLDSEKPNLGRFSACRRVARTLFLGSAPIPGAANRGEEDRRIKLGCVLPGEAAAVFGDALRHLAQAATYLYQDNARYWYATQPTVTKLADDRAEQLRREPDRVAQEIRRRVREDLRSRGDLPKIHPFPANSGEVPDGLDVRLVVLDVENPYGKEGTNLAIEAAKQFLTQRGNSPRIYQNTLVFLAPDRSRLDELEQSTRYYLAWQSIVDQETELNLDKSQSRQAATQKVTWDRTTISRVGETFQWLLVPTQPNAQSPVEWQQSRLSGPDPLAVRACKKLRNDSQMVMQYAATLLRQELDKIPLWRGNHVSVKQLVEDFARYPYLQRVRTPDVLLDSMRDGIALMTWRTDSFAFADGFDEAKGRYLGLRGGQVLRFTGDAVGLLVKPTVADVQLQAERPQPTPKPGEPGSVPTPPGVTGGGPAPTPPTGGVSPTPSSSPPTLFFGSVKVDTTRISRDVASIANEIIQHLATLPDSEVDVTLEIQARVPGGVPDNVVRTVSETCRTLKFSSQHFEQE